MVMLEINDLTREFTRRGARFAAVDHVSFSMDQGELVAIIGRSGNGKSTLLNLIAGLLKPTSGTVEIDGRNVSKLSDKELSQLRNATLGFVTQGQTLLGNLTVLDNVILPAVLFGPAKKTVVPDDVAAPGEADAPGAAEIAVALWGRREKPMPPARPIPHVSRTMPTCPTSSTMISRRSTSPTPWSDGRRCCWIDSAWLTCPTAIPRSCRVARCAASPSPGRS